MMSEEVATVEAEVSESQTEQASEKVSEPAPKDEKENVEGEGEQATAGDETQVKEKPKEEPKPQLSDPEEPDDDVPIALVTGASGYLGSHIIKQLLEQGRFRVRGTVRSLENEIKVKPIREIVSEPRYPLRLIEADLLNADCWKEAVRRCSYVFHVASPITIANPKHPDIIIKPAVEGTTNVLKACSETGTVKRVVLTSSTVSVIAMTGDPNKPKDYVYTEADWGNDATSTTYVKSKVRAEKAAWKLVKELDASKQLELVTICPGFLNGPLFSPSHKEGSLAFTIQILTGKMSRVPDVYFLLTDVRDCAAAHIAALEKPEAAGNRYLVFTENVAIKAMAQVLADEFKPQGYKVSTKGMPKAAMWAAKFVNSGAKLMYPMIGKQVTLSNEKLKGELGITPRPTKETLIDAAYSLIEMGVVPKKSGYIGHPSTRPPPEEPQESAAEQAATEETTTKETGEDEEPKTVTEAPPSEPEKTKEQPTEPAETKEQPTEPPETEEQPTEQAKTEELPSEQASTDEPSSEPAVNEEMPSQPAETTEPTSEAEASKEPTSEPAATEEPPSEPATTEEPTTEEPTSEPAATEEPTSEPAATEEQPSEAAVTEEQPSEPAVTEEQSSEPAVTEEPPSEPAATEEQSSEPAATEEQSSEPAATEDSNIKADSEKPDEQPPSESVQDES